MADLVVSERVRIPMGELVLSSQRFRDQKRNIEDCTERLRGMLLGVLRPPKKRKATRPTRGSKERRLKAKKAQSEKKKNRSGNYD